MKNIDEIPILNHHQIDSLENIAHNYDKVQNPLVRLEHNLHGFSAFLLCQYSLFQCRSYYRFSGINENLMIVLGVVCGLIIGKPLGILDLPIYFQKLKIIKNLIIYHGTKFLQLDF